MGSSQLCQVWAHTQITKLRTHQKTHKAEPLWCISTERCSRSILSLRFKGLIDAPHIPTVELEKPLARTKKKGTHLISNDLWNFYGRILLVSFWFEYNLVKTTANSIPFLTPSGRAFVFSHPCCCKYAQVCCILLQEHGQCSGPISGPCKQPVQLLFEELWSCVSFATFQTYQAFQWCDAHGVLYFWLPSSHEKEHVNVPCVNMCFLFTRSPYFTK